MSAGWKGGRTEWIRIKSLAGEPCRLATDLAEGFVASSSPQAGAAAAQSGPGRVHISLAKDGEILLRRGATVAPAVRAIPATDGISNHYGSKEARLIQPSAPSR